MPELDNDGHPVFLGREAMQHIADELDCFPQATFREARRLAMRVSDHEEMRELLALLDYAQYARKYHLPSQIMNFETRLRAALATSIQTIEKTGGLTGVSSMDPSSEETLSWETQKDGQHIIAANFREGQFGWIEGLPGTGKTVTGLQIIEQWTDMGFDALSNIKLPVPPEGYHYVRNAREHFLRLADVIEANTDSKALLTIDDVSASRISTEYASTNRDKDFNRWSKVAVRKLNCNALIIEQQGKKVPTIFQDFSTSRFMCTRVGGGVVTVNLTGPYRWFKRKFTDFPNTSLPFKSKDIAYFDLDGVDFDKLFMALDGADDQAKAIRRMMEA